MRVQFFFNQIELVIPLYSTNQRGQDKVKQDFLLMGAVKIGDHATIIWDDITGSTTYVVQQYSDITIFFIISFFHLL